VPAVNKNASVNCDVTSEFDVVSKIFLKSSTVRLTLWLTVDDIRRLCEKLNNFYNIQPAAGSPDVDLITE